MAVAVILNCADKDMCAMAAQQAVFFNSNGESGAVADFKHVVCNRDSHYKQ